MYKYSQCYPRSTQTKMTIIQFQILKKLKHNACLIMSLGEGTKLHPSSLTYTSPSASLISACITKKQDMQHTHFTDKQIGIDVKQLLKRYLNSQGSSGRAIAFDSTTFFVNQELGKIPLYSWPQKSSFTSFKEFIDGCRIRAIHTHLKTKDVLKSEIIV